MSRRHLISDPHVCAMVGLALAVSGAWLLYDAHERRGRTRPFLLKFIPGG